jgi:hypothetical protein
MRFALLCLFGLNAGLAVLLQCLTAWRRDAVLHLTAREQFADWHALLAAFRDGDPAVARSVAWCNDTLPAGTAAAPFCACIGAQAQAAANLSASDRGPRAWPLISGCMRLRPPWRLRSVWQIQLATPAVYAFSAAGALFLLATWPSVPWYGPVGLFVLVGGGMLATAPLLNFSWALGLATLLGVLFLVIRPSVAGVARSEAVETFFWWTEGCTVPVFGVYFMLACSRDIATTFAGAVIAAGVGAMSLRSFWYRRSFPVKEEAACRRLQLSAWLAVVLGTSFFVALLPTQGSPLLALSGAVPAMLVTLCMALAKHPLGSIAGLLPLLLGAAGVRNFVFGLLLVLDLTTPGLI